MRIVDLYKMNPDVLQSLIMAGYNPAASQVSRMWREQYVILVSRATVPSSQREIFLACFVGNWMGLTRLVDRADYYYNWHTRCKVQARCSFEMICIYEMVFCGVGRQGVAASLQLAPQYMLLNKDRSVWELSGPHKWCGEYDLFSEINFRGVEYSACSPKDRRIMFIAGFYFDDFPERYWIPESTFWLVNNSVGKRFCIWAALIKIGSFEKAAQYTPDWSHEILLSSAWCGALVKSGYLEGIDFMISQGVPIEKVIDVATVRKVASVLYYYDSAYMKGDRGKCDLIRRAAKLRE